MVRLSKGPDSHNEKKSVNAMNIVHTAIRREVKYISCALTRDRNDAGPSIKDLLTKNLCPPKFYGISKTHKATETRLLFLFIFSSVGILIRRLASWLAKQLNPSLGIFPSGHIENKVYSKGKATLVMIFSCTA